MKTEGRVGLIAGTAGTINPLRTNTQGSLVTQAGGGKYYEAVNNGQVYTVANQTVTAISDALTTGYTGLVVGNAADTEKNLVMLGCGYFTTIAISGAGAIGLMAGQMTAVASTLTPLNRKIGGPASIAWCEDSCTIGTPQLHQCFSYAWEDDTGTGTVGPINWLDLDGSLIITPGSFVAFYSFDDISGGMQFSFMWQEVDA